MSDFATPSGQFVFTAKGLLTTVGLSTISHRLPPPRANEQRAITSPRSFAALAILVNRFGEVTTPEFHRLTTSDRLGGHWENICRLLCTAQPLAAALPEFPDLVGWIDADAELQEHHANMTANMMVRAECPTPESLVYGSLLITGGTPLQPVALTTEQASKALERFLVIDPGDDEGWTGF
jgi:hypothetical protein